MTLKVAVVQVAAPTSPGTVDFTDSGAGFSNDVKVALFAAAASTVNHTSTVHAALSLGMAANSGPTTQHSQGFLTEDAVATMNAGSQNKATKAFLRVGTAATPASVMDADVDSWLSNGVRLNFTPVSGSAELINCLLLGGSSIEAKVLTGSFPGTGNNDLVLAHGLPSAPTMLLVRGDASSPSWFPIGVWDGTNTAGINYSSSNGGATAALNTKLSSSLIIPAFSSVADAYVVQAVDATNVTLRNTGNATGTRNVAVLAISGVTAQAGFFTTDTGTGSTDKITELSVAAKAVIFLETRMTSVGSSSLDEAGAIGIGFAANNNGTIQQASASASEDDGAGPSVAKNQTSATQALRTMDITGAVDYEGVVDAFGPTTVSINTTNAAAVAQEIGYIAFGAPSDGVVWTQYQHRRSTLITM